MDNSQQKSEDEDWVYKFNILVLGTAFGLYPESFHKNWPHKCFIVVDDKKIFLDIKVVHTKWLEGDPNYRSSFLGNVRHRLNVTNAFVIFCYADELRSFEEAKYFQTKIERARDDENWILAIAIANMEKDAEFRAQNKPPRPLFSCSSPPRHVPDLPDAILCDIFRRFDFPEDVIQWSMVCKAWERAAQPIFAEGYFWTKCSSIFSSSDFSSLPKTRKEFLNYRTRHQLDKSKFAEYLSTVKYEKRNMFYISDRWNVGVKEMFSQLAHQLVEREMEKGVMRHRSKCDPSPPKSSSKTNPMMHYALFSCEASVPWNRSVFSKKEYVLFPFSIVAGYRKSPEKEVEPPFIVVQEASSPWKAVFKMELKDIMQIEKTTVLGKLPVQPPSLLPNQEILIFHSHENKKQTMAIIVDKKYVNEIIEQIINLAKEFKVMISV